MSTAGIVKSRVRTSLVAIAVAALAFAACDDAIIDPFQETEHYFTVYGFLDLLETRHSIRVIPVTRQGENIETPSDPGSQIDAQVFTIDDLTGERTRWDHHLVPFSDGTFGHVFMADFIVFPQRSYRLEVIREDGKMTTAETRVPYFTEPNLLIRGPEIFSSDSTVVYQDIQIPQIASPWNIQAVYGWRRGRMGVGYSWIMAAPVIERPKMDGNCA